jgi:hypothetical protein
MRSNGGLNVNNTMPPLYLWLFLIIGKTESEMKQWINGPITSEMTGGGKTISYNSGNIVCSFILAKGIITAIKATETFQSQSM